MPTKSKGDSAPSNQGPALGGPSLAGGSPSLAGSRITLPNARNAWTYCADPMRLICRHGKVLPRLAKAWHTPGMNGNGKDPNGHGQGFVASLQDRGWAHIPHDLECEAFGVRRTRSSVPHSTYLDRYEQATREGFPPVVYWADAWHRPRVLGSRTVWDFDETGWLDFLGRCLAFISPGELDPAQIAVAVEPLVSACRALADRPDVRGKRALRDHLRHLPPASVPEDLRPFLEPAA